jgi:carboxymethylenebutenolidase
MLSDDLKSEFDSLVPGFSGRTGEAGPSRRTALSVALGVGYAAATLPVQAQTVIKTDTAGLAAGQIDYEVAGFKVPAYYAAPQGKTGLPVMLVIQEIFGVTDYIADVCRRFAKMGYLAIAPEMYARQGDPRQYPEIPKLQAEVVSKVPDAQVMADIDGALAWAAAHGGNTAKAGITGFCWGGRIVWLYAATGKVKAGAAFYGRLVGNSSALTPRNPIDVVGELKAPVIGLYGGADSGIPLDTVAKMQTALEAGPAAARASRFVVYRDVGHAFHADYRPSYRAEAAKDGWSQASAWFKSHGVA